MSSLKIVADQQIVLAKEVFSRFGDVELVEGRSIHHDLIKDANVLLVRSITRVNEALLKNSSVSFVGTATSGTDHIDIDYLNNSNITFYDALGSNARSVAEYVLSSLLVLSEQKDFDLANKTVAIIGHGQVGSRVSHFLNTLGVKCLVNDPPLQALNPENDFVEIEDIYQADIITLHVPLISDGEFPTYKLVGDKFLEKLNPDVTIINTSRGQIIDEAALMAFKEENTEATLILDVWCNEPKINIDLINKTFIATPHIAGYSYDGKLKATEMLFNDLNSYLDTKLSLPDSFKTEQEILNIDHDEIQLPVLQSYDVRSDVAALKQMSNLEEKEHASYFDNLRKNYPIRREFRNRVIRSSKMTASTLQKLQQLGFNTATA